MSNPFDQFAADLQKALPPSAPAPATSGGGGAPGGGAGGTPFETIMAQPPAPSQPVMNPPPHQMGGAPPAQGGYGAPSNPFGGGGQQLSQPYNQGMMSNNPYSLAPAGGAPGTMGAAPTMNGPSSGMPPMQQPNLGGMGGPPVPPPGQSQGPYGGPPTMGQPPSYDLGGAGAGAGTGPGTGLGGSTMGQSLGGPSGQPSFDQTNVPPSPATSKPTMGASQMGMPPGPPLGQNSFGGYPGAQPQPGDGGLQSLGGPPPGTLPSSSSFETSGVPGAPGAPFGAAGGSAMPPNVGAPTMPPLGAPPATPQPSYGAPPPQSSYGADPWGTPAPAAPQAPSADTNLGALVPSQQQSNPYSLGAPPAQQNDPYAAPQQQPNPYGAPPPQQTSDLYGAPPPQHQTDPYAPAPTPQQNYGAPPPQQQPNPYGAPPPQQQPNPYGAPPQQQQMVPYGAAPAAADPFSVFEASQKPPELAAPDAGTQLVPAPAPASQDPWGDLGFDAPPGSEAPTSQPEPNEIVPAPAPTEAPPANENNKSNDQADDLPPGGEWYDARIFTPTLGVMFFKPQELTDSLFLNTDQNIVDGLAERPVVAFIVEGSSARAAGVELGHVLLKVNGVDVKNPKEASRLIKEGPRPLPLLFYVPNTDVVVAEGEHMVKYDTRETTAPNSAKDWKPKYVVIGGIIAQPWMMNMYRSKSEYDIAVIETQARRPVSVKVKQFSLQGARIQNDWQGPQMVKYKNKIHPWKYIVVLPVARNPIKISSPNLAQLKPVHEGIRRVLLAQQRDRSYNPHTAAPVRNNQYSGGGDDHYNRSSNGYNQQQAYNGHRY